MTQRRDNPDDECEPSEDIPACAAIADGILDGQPIDWTTAAGGALDPALTEQLRVLADISAAHRTLAAGMLPQPAGAAEPLSSGCTWGHLELLERVGRGAFGEVFRAWDPHLHREVALKLFPPDDTTQGAARRTWVLEEARFLASIRHPNVVTVHGADRIDGRVGFWTEFIRGQTLAELVHEHGPLDVREAAAIGIDVCVAIAAVHRAGLLHRDVKATNVMREGNGRIVLLDFGASRDFEAEALASASPHAEGPTGTPLYVAPEVWRGEAATPQSDLYSVGVLLYFLVTGSYPVRGAAVREVGDAHRAGRRTWLREHATIVGPAFAAVVDKAIDPNPLKRFATAEAFEAALRNVLAVMTPSARTGFRYRASRVSIAVVILLIGLGTWIVPRTWHAVVPPPTRGVGPTQMPPFTALGRPSHDGRLYPMVDQSGRLLVWNDTTGRSHVVAAPAAPREAGAGSSLMSPDGERVAYEWRFSDGTMEVRVSNADGTQPRLLLERRAEYQPYLQDWSRDGRFILLWLRQRNNATDLVLAPVDRSAPRLVYSKIGGIPDATLSPDGRFIVTVRASETKPDRRELIEFDVNNGGSARVLLAPNDERAPAWTADGTHVVFLRPSSQNKGMLDAWQVRVVDGRAQDPAVRVVENVGPTTGVIGSVTDDNRFQWVVPQGANDIYLASIDFSGARPDAGVRIEAATINQHAGPSWSPDGRSIAYFTLTPSALPGMNPSRALTLQDVASGKSRTLHPALEFLGGYRPEWFPDEGSVAVWGRDTAAEGRLGYYRVDLQTSRATPLLLRENVAVAPGLQVLRDGSGVLYRHEHDGILMHKFAGGHDVVVVSARALSGLMRFVLSPDGHSLAFVGSTKSGGEGDVLDVRSLEGGERQVLRSKLPERLDLQAWSADGQRLLYQRCAPGARPELWAVPATGGEPSDLHFSIPLEPNPISVHPDGIRIAYAEMVNDFELWSRPIPR